MAGAKCENCGSALEAPPAGQDFLQCHYCGHRSQLQQPRVVTQERIVVVHERRVPSQAWSRRTLRNTSGCT
ncbi:MAG: hypothetical protein ACRELY_20310 [Polyangiaceae bacterium]